MNVKKIVALHYRGQPSDCLNFLAIALA